MASANFNRLYNRHRVTPADRGVIQQLETNLGRARNPAETRQRTETIRRVYGEFERKYSWMFNFIQNYNLIPSHKPVAWVKHGKSKIATTFTYTVVGWENIFDVLLGDFVGASEGFYDPVLHGPIKCVITIVNSSNGVVKIITDFSNLLNRLRELKLRFRQSNNQDTVVSGDITNDENERYTVIIKFITNRFNFQAFLDSLNNFSL